MEGIHIDQVTLPVQLLSVGPDVQSHQVLDGTGRAMVPRNPLGIHQRYRSGTYRDGDGGVQNVARSVRSVNPQALRDGGLRGGQGSQQKQNGSQTAVPHGFSWLFLLVQRGSINLQISETR